MPQVVNAAILDLGGGADFLPKFLDAVKWFAGGVAWEYVGAVCHVLRFHALKKFDRRAGKRYVLSPFLFGRVCGLGPHAAL